MALAAGALGAASGLMPASPVQAQPTAATADGALPDKSVRRIAALLAAKSARTAAQRKISSRLLDTLRPAAGRRPAIDLGRDERVTVDIRAKVTPELLARIEVLGGTVVNSVARYRAVRAQLPLAAVETLAAEGAVHGIRPAGRPISDASRGAGAAEVANRARFHLPNTSEGDVAHQAAAAREMYGVAGAGIGIGVLSLGVDDLSLDQGSGDLPSGITILPGQEGGAGTHGTATLEIVYDLAPGADLYFATAEGGNAQFAANIEALCDAGANVIVDNIGSTHEPAFQDGVLAQGANAAIAKGCFYFGSAGNFGNLTSGTSGVWEGDYVQGGELTVDGESVGHSHDFGGGAERNGITRDGGNGFVLQWADPLGASTNDYDLFLVDRDGDVLASSTDTQDGTQDPFEYIARRSSGVLLGSDYRGDYLVVVLSSGSGRFLRLHALRGRLQRATDGAVVGHLATADAITVGQVDVRTAANGVFDGSESIRDTSGDGPRRVFFRADGTPITAGDFSASGGELLQKPELAAAGCVSTASAGLPVFCGTSAAAPHAAAIAALALQGAGGPGEVTLAELRAALAGAAIDIGDPGVDRDSSAGIVMAPAAVQALWQGPGPVATLPGRTLALGGDAVSFDVAGAFSDPQDDPLTYTASADAGAVAVSVTGSVVTLTPVATGSAAVRVVASEADGPKATQSFEATVVEAALKSLTIADGDSVEWALNPAFDSATTSYTATVGSAVSAVTVTALATDPAASVVSDPEDSHAAAGFQVALGASQTTITITVTAADGVTRKEYTIAVTRDATAPVLSGAATVSFAENGAVRVATYTATDPAEIRLVWTLSGTDAGLFAIDEPDGALRFEAPPDFENPVDDDEDNVYELTVVVTDRASVASRSVAVTVTGVDEPGTVTLSANRPRMAAELTASVTDPDVEDPAAAWRWERSSGRSAPDRWTVIEGATSAGYTPVAADAGEFLRVTATYDDGGEKTVSAATANVVTAKLLSGLQATTQAATAEPSRALRPAFGPEVLHYAIGCGDDDTMTLTLSAEDASRLAVDGVQAASGNATVSVPVTGQSEVSVAVTGSDGASTTYTVHCLASDFFDIEATRFAGAADVMQDLILMSGGRYVALLDNNGVPRFRRRVGRVGAFLRLAYVGDQEEYRYSYIEKVSDTTNVVAVLDEHFTRVDTGRTVSPLDLTDSHDQWVLPNGNYLVMSYEPATRDLSHLTFDDADGNPYGSREEVRDSAIQIVAPGTSSRGTPEFHWNSWDHMALEDCAQHRFPDDYAHLNSMQLVDGRIIGSFRGCSKVLAIDADTGDVVWRIGRSNLSAAEWASRGIGPVPLAVVRDPEGEFCGQHAAQILPTGNLILFDNGAHCTKNPWTDKELGRKSWVYSRAVEYALDFDNGEAVFLRDYSPRGQRDRLGQASGHVDVLGNGDWLISWGKPRSSSNDGPGSGDSPYETVTQVDPDTGEEKFALVMTDPGTGRLERIRAIAAPPSVLARAPGPLAAAIAGSPSTSEVHVGAADRPRVVVAFDRPVVDAQVTASSANVAGAGVESVAPWIVAGAPANAYAFVLRPAGLAPITFSLAGGTTAEDCDSGGICTAGGTRLSSAPAAHVIPLPPPVPVTATLTGLPHPTREPFAVAIAFSEPVTGLELSEIAVSGGAASNLVGSGTNYSVEIAPDMGVDGEVLVTVPAGAVTDALNNVNLESTAAFRVDTKAPALAAGGAVVNGAALTLVFDEVLDAAARPAGAFTVTAGGAPRQVAAVSVSGSSATLTLDPAVTRGDGAASVSYTPPAAGGLRDELGNPVAAFADERAANETPNAAPTGRPTITGSALVGETLQASVAGIADADGMAGAAFRYRWLRSEGAADTDIPGAASAEYTIQPADERRLLKVRVTFTDGGGTEERLTSAATGEVAALRPSVDGRALAEASGTVTVTVGTGGVQVAGAQTIELELGGTATRGTDYRIGSDRLQLVAGASAVTTTVTAVDDAVDDDGETIEITARLGSRTLGVRTVTIVDDDERGVAVSRSVVEVPEGGSERYTVVLTSEPTAPVEVTLSAELSGTDLSVDRTRLDFTRSVGFTGRSWDVPRSVELSAAEDDDALADPAVIIRHKAAGGDYASTAGPAVEARIVEDDSPVLSVGEASAMESAGAVVFEVTLSTAGSADATVDYATSDGTAAAGSDYTATAGKLRFAAGSSAARWIVVDVMDDAEDEEEEETFRLTLRNARGASLAGGGRELAVAGTILDDDDPAVAVSFGSARYDVAEGAVVEMSVGLSADPERALEIPLVATHLGGATARDYAGLPASVGFGPGLTRQSFAVLAVDDPEEDAGESVAVGFGELPAGVAGGVGTVLVIGDNDGGERPPRPPGGGRNRAPQAVGTLADLRLEVGESPSVEVSGAFRDRDGDVLTYAAEASSPEVAEVAAVSVSGGVVTVSVTALSAGESAVTVTATDAEGSNRSATQAFTVTVSWDADGDGLIGVRTLSQLDAVRHDLDGDGMPAAAGSAAYAAAFGVPGTGAGTATVSCPAAGGCRGYELGSDLDFDTNGSGGPDAGDAYWDDGAGWLPLGTMAAPFTAAFEGNGRVVRGLFVHRGDGAGLFGTTGTSGVIRGVGVTAVEVTGGSAVGGLVGLNGGVVTGSHATGRVSGSQAVGGLVGANAGAVGGSYASVAVSGASWVGGLVGFNDGDIAAVQATGRVLGSHRAGGLVGYNRGALAAGYATGRVWGEAETGGLVGTTEPPGTVTDSFWDTDRSGRAAGESEDGAGSAGRGLPTAALQAPVDYAGLYAAWNVDVDGDDAADDPWDFGTPAQYPALSLDVDGDGVAGWREVGRQLRAGPKLTAALAVDPVQVSLTWTAVDAGAGTRAPAVSYTVHRETGGAAATVATDVRGLRYVDLGVEPGSAYRYQVAAVVAGGEAARSALVPAEVPCAYTVTPLRQDLLWTAGTGEVRVSTGPACAWTAASESEDFLTVTSGAAGTGSGTVTWAVEANAGVPRTGVLLVAGRRVTVYQASPTVFTDHPIEPGVTPVRAIHFLELRARINELRTGAGLPAFGWTNRVLTPGVTPVKRVHLTELRQALAAAQVAAGRPAPDPAAPAVAAGRSVIKATHLMELRAAVAALE